MRSENGQSLLLPGLTVAMSAFNEAHVIADAIRSVSDLADEVIVVDCSSTDETALIARDLGARVFREPNRLMLNINKNIAFSRASYTWTMLVDPDERPTAELRDAVRSVVSGVGAFAAYRMPRLNHELGVEIRSMGHYPDLQLRLFRTGKAKFACLHIHESVEVDGLVGDLRGDLLHYPKSSLNDYVQKRNLYSDHRAAQMAAEGSEFQLHRLIFRPWIVFFKNFLLRSGWRDGVAGFIIAVIGAFGTFLQDAKLWQIGRAGQPDPGGVIGSETAVVGAAQPQEGLDAE